MKSLLAVVLLAPSLYADLPEFAWDELTIDEIEIGYGLALTDVDGDGDTDIALADKSTVQWYENPGWEKHLIARDLTVRDNVCIAARDIDGDGKCEIAIGGQWNFLETQKDGAVTYLVSPDDPREMWQPVSLAHEPSVHRMHWIAGADRDYSLVVKPLRGRGSLDSVGPGIRILEYFPERDWETRLVSDFLHLSHNFHPVNWDDDPEEELIVGAKEGIWYHDRVDGAWTTKQLTENFTGELRDGTLPGGRRFLATVEPMHGTKSAVYLEPIDPGALWPRSTVLSDTLVDGHAVAIDDFLGIGSDQVVVGWRAMKSDDPPGITLFTPLDEAGENWRETKVSRREVAVEDIKSADLDGNGKADLVAAARQTKNLKIFFSK